MRSIALLLAFLPSLALAAPGHIDAQRDHPTLTVDGTALPLAPELLVSEDASGRASPPAAPGPIARARFTWRRDPAACPDPREPCEAAVGEAVSPDGALQVTLRLARDRAGSPPALEVEARWKKRAWVHLLAIDLVLPGDRVTVMGRDLRPTPARVAYLGRFDPKWVTVARAGRPRFSVEGDDADDGLTVQVAAGRVSLRLELDDAQAHPFTHDAQCTTNWHLPNRHLTIPARLRIPDDRITTRLLFLPPATPPVVESRWPDGRRAAFVITDHADQTSERTLAVLADALEKHHLVITKALFAHGTDRPQLDDPKVVAIADRMYQDGSEIVPHSATPRRDDRAVTQAALDRFERWHARTWIDHQPETNCEAFGDEGFRVGGRFGIADLLAAHAYPYVWAEDDAPPGDFNLEKPHRLGERAPTVWPLGRLDLGGPDSLWMFRTVWAFLPAAGFYAMYSPAALDRLENQRGLHIAHTYLETYHHKHTHFGARDLFVPMDPHREVAGGAGPVAIDPRFEALLADLERRQASGGLWIPTLARLADRLRATAALTLTPRGPNELEVSTPARLDGATFVVARAGLQVTVDGKPPRGRRTEGGETIFWTDLPAGRTRIRLEPPGPRGKPSPPKRTGLAHVENP